MRRIAKFFIRIFGFVRKEIVTVLRQPRLVFSLILGPFIILLLFGIGYRETPRTLRTLFVVAAALAAYDRWVLRPALVIGVVDVAEVYRAKEAEFTQILTKASSEEDRQKALFMARAFAQRLPLALDELPRECNCLVILRTAVAGPTPNTVDLTAQLRRKVAAP